MLSNPPKFITLNTNNNEEICQNELRKKGAIGVNVTVNDYLVEKIHMCISAMRFYKFVAHTHNPSGNAQNHETILKRWN